MTRDDRFSRRSIVKLTGASAATALIAGCGGPETDNESADQDDSGAAGEGEADENDTGDELAPGDEENETGNETVDNETADNETDNETADNETGNETADNETGNESAGNESGGVSEEWQGVEAIELGGDTAAWQGVAPAPIEGEDNPTLELTEGTEYDITWENVDGQPHNIEIWDENEEVVEDYQTEIIEEEGESQTLTFEATSEMAEYVCQVHVGSMIGDIEVQSG